MLPYIKGQSAPEANPIFPLGFKFGVSTSAYQIEENTPDSNWKSYENKQNEIHVNPKLRRKCEGLSRFTNDIDLIKDLKTQIYRFSLSWSRINPKEDYYDESIINVYRAYILKLKESGIEPMIVLWNFEHPQWLEEKGGFKNDIFIEKFCDYVNYLMRKIGDLIDFYQTLNEPFLFVFKSLIKGDYPPGKGNVKDAFNSIVNLMQCHVNAYHIIHERNQNAKVSYSKNITPFLPKHNWSLVEHFICYLLNYSIRIGFDIFKTEKLRFLFMCKEIRGIAKTLDYIALNHFHVNFISINFRDWNRTPFISKNDDLFPLSDIGHEIIPESLAVSAKWIHELYNKEEMLPIIITEHGIADVEDTKRKWFIKDSLIHLSIISKEIPLKGYIHWCLMDCYEWTEGMDKKYGLYYVNHDTQERKPRESSQLYKEIVEINANQPDF